MKAAITCSKHQVSGGSLKSSILSGVEQGCLGSPPKLQAPGLQPSSRCSPWAIPRGRATGRAGEQKPCWGQSILKTAGPERGQLPWTREPDPQLQPQSADGLWCIAGSLNAPEERGPPVDNLPVANVETVRTTCWALYGVSPNWPKSLLLQSISLSKHTASSRSMRKLEGGTLLSQCEELQGRGQRVWVYNSTTGRAGTVRRMIQSFRVMDLQSFPTVPTQRVGASCSRTSSLSCPLCVEPSLPHDLGPGAASGSPVHPLTILQCEIPPRGPRCLFKELHSGQI